MLMLKLMVWYVMQCNNAMYVMYVWDMLMLRMFRSASMPVAGKFDMANIWNGHYIAPGVAQ